jgi:hypothetical protein
VNQKEPKEKLFFGLFSAREAFYYPFAIFVIATGLIYWWIFTPDSSEKARVPEDPRQIVADTIGGALYDSHVVPLSDTQLLFYDSRAKTNAWKIYDAVTHTVTNDIGFARAFENDSSAHSNLANGFSISSCNGNIVLALGGSTNSPAMIYEWSTNSDKLQVFDWNDFKGNQRGMSPYCVKANNDGWIYCKGYITSGQVPIFVTGLVISPRSTTYSFPTNLGKNMVFPFEGGLYASAFNTNTMQISAFILDYTTQSILYSNTSAKPPVNCDFFSEFPSLPGNRILWTFYSEPTVALKISNVLPHFLAEHVPTDQKGYYYWSDSHVTKFHFIMSIEIGMDQPASFCWGTNGDSVWLPDDKYGVKRYDLK